MDGARAGTNCTGSGDEPAPSLDQRPEICTRPAPRASGDLPVSERRLVTLAGPVVGAQRAARNGAELTGEVEQAFQRERATGRTPDCDLTLAL